MGDLSGELLDDRYRIHERIAEGAMGVVYRGTRLNLDRAVAIKVMHASMPSEMGGRKRFEREATLMAKLEHPHCVSIIDYGVHGTKPYVVMELVRGQSLHDLLVEQRRFEIPRAVDVMKQVLSGLAHAHEQGIIHRDIKPANIMVTPKAPLGVHVRILDFGLARMLEGSTSVSNGVAVGTPSYMAPEQCRGEPIEERVDIYACGVVLFEMLTGRKPFEAGDPISIVKKQLEESPPRLADVTQGDYGALEDVIARALSKSPAGRYPSAVAMAEALDAAVSGRVMPERTAVFEPIQDRSISIPITVGSEVIVKREPPGSSIRRELPVSRMRWLLLAALVAAVAGVALVVANRERLFGDAPQASDDATVTVVTPLTLDAAAAPAPAPAPSDPAHDLALSAKQLAESGKVEAAIDSLVKARKVYPQSAELAVAVAKLYFAKLWWADGISNARDALRLDPTLRNDPELINLVVRGFNATPSYDARLANLLIEIGAPAKPLLEETAHSHANASTRARAESLLRRMK